MKGSVYRTVFTGRGHVQRGERYAIVLQSDDLWSLSTWLVAPTTGRGSAAAAPYRPDVEIQDTPGRVLVEQMRVVDIDHLGPQVGFLSHEELQRVDVALRLVLELT